MQSLLADDFLWRNRRWLAVAAIVLSILTWASDLTGLVYECPYCRTQRTVIGLLGLLLLTPLWRHWIGRMMGTVLGVLGLVVAATQHFNSWKKIMAGTFEWGPHWYIHPWLLSGFALFIISGLLMIIWEAPARRAAEALPPTPGVA